MKYQSTQLVPKCNNRTLKQQNIVQREHEYKHNDVNPTVPNLTHIDRITQKMHPFDLLPIGGISMHTT
jgi:hypothetical protein